MRPRPQETGVSKSKVDGTGGITPKTDFRPTHAYTQACMCTHTHVHIHKRSGMRRVYAK